MRCLSRPVQTWKRVVPSILTLVCVVALIAVLYRYRGVVSEFAGLGYLGAFLIGLIANATIILPMPGLALLISLGTVFNPLLVALLGAFGGTLGELSGYAAGLSGRGFVDANNKWLKRAERWIERRGMLTIFCFSLFPFLPFDVAGLVAGGVRMHVVKFGLACFLGKFLLYAAATCSGVLGWEFLQRWLGL